MATTYTPLGLLSDDMQTAAPWTGKVNQTYQIDPANPLPIYFGDPVTIVGGYIAAYTSAMQSAFRPILGSFGGIHYKPATNSGYISYSKQWTGSSPAAPGTPIYATVEDQPDTEFKIVADLSSGTTIASTLLNATFVFGAPTALSIANGTSTVGIASIAVGATTDPLKVMGIFDGTSFVSLNQWSTTGANAVICPFPTLLVKMNNHMWSPGTIGIA